MSEIVQVMSTIPQDKQHILHEKAVNFKPISNTFNLSQDLALGIIKELRIYLLMIVIRLFKIQLV